MDSTKKVRKPDLTYTKKRATTLRKGDYYVKNKRKSYFTK
jgi:hypothetical protein